MTTRREIRSVDADPDIRHAINTIRAEYGDEVSVEQKSKSLHKFGRNLAVGSDAAGYTLMTLAGSETNETYATGNTITHVSSGTDTDDQDLVVEGHTLSGSNLLFKTQTIALTGRTKAPLTTPLYRATRAYNDDDTNLGGAVYVFEDDTLTDGVPNTDTKVKLMIVAGKNQSQKASTSLSSTDYWIITEAVASIETKNQGKADIEIQVRRFGKVFRELTSLSAEYSSGSTQIRYKPYLVIPKNADVRMVAVGSGAGLDVKGELYGYLATVVG